ncbi:MAG: filamentous hemagglutinin N-terminal domain-containing protein, partial [Pleurocapsa sp.]
MNNCLRLVSYLALNIACVFYGVHGNAQVIPDSTTITIVDTNGNNFKINLGDRAGNNLFHSFTEFSLPNGGIASFNNQADIVNIFSRVTSGNISDINGLIRANGNANLFIINPSGIIFGENASLDIGGSFFASSASSIIFDEGEFSTTDTETSPLLTINAPLGLDFQDNPGDIVNRSGSIENDSLASDRNGLEVTTGNSIAFLGGNVNFDGGKITAPGGRVELGGLLEAGEIDLNPDNSFSFPLGIERADVNLSDFASVNVTAGGGGFINVNAKNLTLTGQSELFAGIAENMGSPDALAGDITIDTTESIRLIGSDLFAFQTEIDDLDTAVRNHVGLPPQIGSDDFNNDSPRNPQLESTAQGNAGSIIVRTDLLEVRNRAALTSKIYGQGNTGNIQVTANEILLDGGDLLNQVREGGRGNAGNITVDTEFLSAGDLSFIISDVDGVGDGGDITINASEGFSISGESQLNIQIQENANGNAGNIEINTSNFSLQDGANIFANTSGTGNAGNVLINAREQITLQGASDNYSEIFTSVGSNARGNAGNITVDTQRLNISNGSIFSFTNGKGDAGNITINALDRVLLDGSNDDADIGPTQLNVQVQSDGEGNAGNIEINTSKFSLEGGAFVLANTKGNGNG